MNMYVLFKNQVYAEKLASETGAKVRTESSINGISPDKNDIIIIDAHCGNNMVELHGFEIVNRLQKKFVDNNLKFKILSWFEEEHPKIVQKKSQYLSGKENVQFIQLPINDLSTLTI